MLTLLALSFLAQTAAPTNTPPKLVAKGRAWSIEASQVQGAPLLKFGDRIDVLAVIPDPETKLPTAVTLLQNVRILANKPIAPGGPAFVSLLVIPEEAELLALARAAGTISFSQRTTDDVEILEEGKPVTLKALLGH